MADDRTWKDLGRTGVFLLAFGALGLFVLFMASPGNRAIPAVVALATGAVAGVLGFLFAVPRVLQGSGNSNTEDGSGAQVPVYRMHINTNLEQISDWLTKIMVGIGLSQLWTLPSSVTKLGLFLAPAFGGDSQGLILASAALVYFTSIGFLSGYLLTRIYLSGAFRRADADIVGGLRVTFAEVREQQGRMLADLQSQVIDIRSGTSEPPLDERIAGESGGDKVSSILWVDDNPRDNVLMVDRLHRINVDVVNALTTSDALRALSSRGFDRVISNMGRTEDGQYDSTAGVTLIRKIREASKDARIVIFCDATEAASHRAAALEAGASAVTSSPTVLLDELQLDRS